MNENMAYYVPPERTGTVRKADELMRILLDTTPFGIHFWDRDKTVIDCNQATVSLFGLSSKRDFLEGFFDFSPEFQPDGQPSRTACINYVEKTFKEGYQRFEWLHRKRSGEMIPCELTLVRLNNDDDDLVAAYTVDLREQKRMMQEVKGAAAQLKAVVANYPGAICSADSDFNITLFDGLLVPNLIDKSLFLEGQDLNKALQKDEFKHIMGKLRQTLTDGPQNWSFEANGKVLNMTTTPIFGERNETEGFVAKIEDITEMTNIQKELKDALDKAEEAVKASEIAQITTSTMFEANPHINVLFNDKFKVIDCNPAAVSFFGFEKKEDLLNGFIERMVRSIPEHQPDGRASIPLSERLITTVKDGSVNFKTELIMGSVKKNLDVEFKRIPYAGSFAIVGYVYDMTEIHERELELARAHDLNKLQLTKLNLAVKASKIGLWDIEVVRGGPSGSPYAFTCSDEFRGMLGFSDENDFPNRLESWSDLIHPDDIDMVFEAFDGHLLDKTGNTHYSIEYRIKKKTGEYAYFHDSCEAMRDAEGNALRIAGALVDITETKIIILDSERQTHPYTRNSIRAPARMLFLVFALTHRERERQIQKGNEGYSSFLFFHFLLHYFPVNGML